MTTRESYKAVVCEHRSIVRHMHLGRLWRIEFMAAGRKVVGMELGGTWYSFYEVFGSVFLLEVAESKKELIRKSIEEMESRISSAHKP